MKHKSNKNQKEEYLIENNEPEELTKVTLPPRWWFVQSSFGWLKGKNPKILQLYKHIEKEKITPSIPSWDIKRGDYISNPDEIQRKLTRESKAKIEIAFLIGFVIIVVLLIFLISSFLADKVS